MDSVRSATFELRSFKNLVVWQKAQDLTVELYRITNGFPKSELYGVTSQIRRAASSVAANVSEGNSMTSFPKKEYSFYAIAKGSADEVRSWLDLSYRLGYIDKKSTFDTLEDSTQEIIRLLIGLMRRVRTEIA